MTRVLVIAEAGVNHNGDIELAKQLVDAAADAGADIVKFQTFVADRITTASVAKAAYQKSTTSAAEVQQEMLRRLELSPAMHEILIERCRLRGIEFLSTGFDIDSVDLLVSLGLATFKIPSGEITNLPYLRHIGRLGGKVLLSTGMSTLGEVEAALYALQSTGASRDSIVVLHCTSEYPAPIPSVNLRAMCTMGAAFGVAVGYSDHTAGYEIPIAAVALGAVVIEKHFTLDRSLPGPDHRSSLEPDELGAMVRAIRNVKRALGDGIKRPTTEELLNRVVARKVIVAARPIQKGEPLGRDNMTTKRAAHGTSPMRWDSVVGRPALRDYHSDEPIDVPGDD